MTAAACPAPDSDTPLVRGLLGVVDCNTQALVHSGYSALFAPSGGFTGALTAILTIYVAFIGYRLMLGQSQLRVGEFAVTAVKIGAVLALATQWDAYQALIYRFLFEAPQQLASALLGAVHPAGSALGDNVFDGLQRAFDDLSGFATGYASHATPQTSPFMGGTGLGALVLTSSATILLLSSLGVLLTAKIVLSLLLAVGPIFIALFLFDGARGLFEGWLRASIAFAFAPFASILLLGVALNMLEPSLLQMEELRQRGVFVLGPVYSVATLVLVFAAVSVGAIIAGGMIASGFRLPERRTAAAASEAAASPMAAPPPSILSRAERVAAAAGAIERRDSRLLATARTSAAVQETDRRTQVVALSDRRSQTAPVAETRLGQSVRRVARPRTLRSTAGGAF
jgi:type IV secretion system protein VirB6